MGACYRLRLDPFCLPGKRFQNPWAVKPAWTRCRTAKLCACRRSGSVCPFVGLSMSCNIPTRRWTPRRYWHQVCDLGSECAAFGAKPHGIWRSECAQTADEPWLITDVKMIPTSKPGEVLTCFWNCLTASLTKLCGVHTIRIASNCGIVTGRDLEGNDRVPA